MNRKIHITGASGSGTTTLGAALSRSLNIKQLDTDHYFWRNTEVPYTEKEHPGNRIESMKRDLERHQNWLISGSLCGWGDTFIEEFTHVIFLYASWNIRRERLLNREIHRYGEDAIKPGGKMYQVHTEFFDWAGRYDSAGFNQRSRVRHLHWLDALPERIRVIRIESDQRLEAVLKEALAGLF